MSRGRRVAMIDSNHPQLSIARQCTLVSIARSTFYYTGKGETPLNLKLMRLIDEQFMDTPYYGARQMAHSQAAGLSVPDQGPDPSVARPPAPGRV